MKLNLKTSSILIIIGFCINIVNVSARRLTHKEQEIASSLNELTRLNSEYLSKINASVKIEELPLSKYLSLLVLKNGCAPFKQTLEKIEMADESFPDQSHGLVEKLSICKRSTNGLKEFDVFAKVEEDMDLLSDE
ncbi:hypothetical protein BALOs_1677 [Halobacteriovorax sp. BALOs_7]|uniref:hypothetical protein n=1 Tax=Halobacteriovorax sp. BALOs_7 TaxID=2109558 RepID=UPI000EA1D0B7|nr:hypothetical protein [Halobacteriovorax sp. BALOs_7]AYF44677.1 hypothetical protein BALOs_1677 [Halobacteriovorax sp. BALOs_7]